jgi:monoamine oxidase
VRRLGLKLIPILRLGFSFALSSKGKIRAPITTDKMWERLRAKLKPLLQQYELSEQRWDGAVAKRLGSLSVQDWMDGASLDGDLKEMLVGMRGFFLADPTQLSLLSLIDQVASGTPGKGRMYRIEGGNDRLPALLGSVLRERVHLRHEILAVSQTKSKIRVRVRDGRDSESSLDADYLVLALPATKLRTLEFNPPLPPEQAASIARLHYGPVTKTLLQFDRRFWKRRQRPLAYGTNLLTGAVWDANEHQAGRPGILCLMAGGSTSAATQDRLATGGALSLARDLDWLGKTKKTLLASHSVIWEEDPWVLGGYAVFGPDYDPTLRSWLARPHGRVIFAGEHTSLRWQGYMNGAVESGLRAAAEINVLSRPILRA